MFLSFLIQLFWSVTVCNFSSNFGNAFCILLEFEVSCDFFTNFTTFFFISRLIVRICLDSYAICSFVVISSATLQRFSSFILILRICLDFYATFSFISHLTLRIFLNLSCNFAVLDCIFVVIYSATLHIFLHFIIYFVVFVSISYAILLLCSYFCYNFDIYWYFSFNCLCTAAFLFEFDGMFHAWKMMFKSVKWASQ